MDRSETNIWIDLDFYWGEVDLDDNLDLVHKYDDMKTVIHKKCTYYAS